MSTLQKSPPWQSICVWHWPGPSPPVPVVVLLPPVPVVVLLAVLPPVPVVPLDEEPQAAAATARKSEERESACRGEGKYFMHRSYGLSPRRARRGRATSAALLACGALSIDAAPVRIAAALALLLGLAPALACSRPESAAPAPPPSASAAGRWSRDALSAPSAERGPTEPPVLASADPSALDELLRKAPSAAARPTGSSGGTALGEETHLPEGAPLVEPPPAETQHRPVITVGAPVMQATMANPAIERAARAQLYWNLVQRCRDREGKILPADAVHLKFNIDADGYIASSSIIATAADPRFSDAAHCMRRELSTATFRAPAATRGQLGVIDATVPSVD